MAGLRAALRYMRRSPISRWLVVSALAMVMALFTSQYLYSEAFVRRFPEPARLAAFFGVFLLASNAAELVVELWLTPLLIRRFGVASANLLHPLTSVLAFAGLAFDFSLVPAVAARLNREMLDNGLGQPVRNLVYNALPQRLRGRMRAFLEGIVVYSGMAVAGAALLALPGGIRGERDVRLLCVLGASLALLYLAANLAVRRAYLGTLVEELRAGRLDLRDVGDALGGFEVASLAALWRELLARPAPGASGAAARELAPLLAARGLVEPLVFAAGHRDADVRRASIEALGGVREEAAHAALLGALHDREAAVRVAALRAIGAGRAPRGAAPRGSARAPPRSRRRRARRGRDALRRRGARRPRGAWCARSARRRRWRRSRGCPSALQWLARERAFDADAERLRRGARAPSPASAAAESVPTAAGRASRSSTPRRRCVSRRCRCSAPRAPRRRPRAVGASLDDPARAVRAAGSEALGRLGDLGVAAAQAHLDAPRLWTVDAALAAIGRIATPRARGVLAEDLRRRVRASWDHLLALHAMAEPADLALRFLRAAHASALGRELRLAFRVIEVAEGPAVVRSVQRTLRLGPARARADALEVLSNLGDRQAAGLLALLHESGPRRG